MADTFIPGGYILLSRRLMESGIMQKPPIYFKIWTWLLLKAQHKDYGNLKRGQLITSIPEIQEAMSYNVGFRVEKPSKKQVWGVLEWLRNPEMENSSEILVNNIAHVTMTEPMIVTTKVTHGILVTIVKYNVYQDPKNYEGNDEGTMTVTMTEQRGQRQGNNINKNDKNEKNDKKVVIDLSFRELLNQLKNIDNYPFDIEKDTDFINSLLVDFPTLDIKEELKKWAIYKLDKPLTKKSNARSQFRNWCKKSAEWKAEKEPQINTFQQEAYRPLKEVGW